MAGKLIHIFREFLALIFPSRCLDCGIKNKILCEDCLAKFPDIFTPTKPWIFSATSYQDEIVKKAIWLFKYKGLKILAEPLAELIYQRFKETRFPLGNSVSKCQSDCVIIPIPLSKKRFRRRGYNQSELMAQFLSDKMSIRMAANVLYKTKETISQVEIKDREKRLKNLEGAFEIKNSETIKDKNIILVDDIITTGATLSEAKKVLLQAGAKKIIGITLAR